MKCVCDLKIQGLVLSNPVKSAFPETFQNFNVDTKEITANFYVLLGCYLFYSRKKMQTEHHYYYYYSQYYLHPTNK